MHLIGEEIRRSRAPFRRDPTQRAEHGTAERIPARCNGWQGRVSLYRPNERQRATRQRPSHSPGEIPRRILQRIANYSVYIVQLPFFRSCRANHARKKDGERGEKSARSTEKSKKRARKREKKARREADRRRLFRACYSQS